MTTLEQYKKAYATLAGRVDTIITGLERIEKSSVEETAAIAFAIRSLTGALEETEEIFLAEDPEDLND